jgi:ATP-dependent Clp protease ATP-binding subunit ClpC
LKRTIQRLVENELSRMVLGGQVQAGDRVVVDALEGELRIDDIIVFRALTAEQLHEITRLMLDRLARRLRAQRIEIAFTDEAVELLAHEGYDPEFGARPLKRTIQRLVENELSRMVLGGQVQAGDRVVVDALEGELRIDVESRPAIEPTEEAAQPDAVQS